MGRGRGGPGPPNNFEKRVVTGLHDSIRDSFVVLFLAPSKEEKSTETIRDWTTTNSSFSSNRQGALQANLF